MTKQSFARFAKGAKGGLARRSCRNRSLGRLRTPLTGAPTRLAAGFAGVNPGHAREFARSTGPLAKTDRVDAEMPARMGQALPRQPTPPTPPERVELAELVARCDDPERDAENAGKPPKPARIACARKRRTILSTKLCDTTDFGDKTAV